MTYLFWLSFRDVTLNKWLGGCFVFCDTQQNAIIKTHKLHINPGGEVVVTPKVEVNDEIIEMIKSEGYKLDYLYTKKEDMPSSFERIPEEYYD